MTNFSDMLTKAKAMQDKMKEAQEHMIKFEKNGQWSMEKAEPRSKYSTQNKNKQDRGTLHSRKFKSGENGKLTLLVRSSRDSRKGCSLFISSIKILSRSYPDLCQRIKVISIGPYFFPRTL